MKESLGYIIISIIVFSITYLISLLTGIELITYAVIISFVLQWTLFIPAYFFQTEKFYDISGSINFISIVIYIYYYNYITHGFNLGNLILSLLIFIWAVRLGVFLFLRIQNDGEDKRFRSIKPSPSKFFMTWTLQATWVSICSLCALTGISSDSGIIINNLFFIGLTFFSFSSLSNLQFVTLISPIFTYLLLVYVSGVKLLEANGNKKWGHLKSYKDYIKKTPRLLFK